MGFRLPKKPMVARDPKRPPPEPPPVSAVWPTRGIESEAQEAAQFCAEPVWKGGSHVMRLWKEAAELAGKRPALLTEQPLRMSGLPKPSVSGLKLRAGQPRRLLTRIRVTQPLNENTVEEAGSGWPGVPEAQGWDRYLARSVAR